MSVVSVSLPDDLLTDVDHLIAEREYGGRSELVRAALRDFLARESGTVDDTARTATLTLLYPDGYERKIGELRHDFTDVIRSMMHGHARGLCVEVFVLEGHGRRIQRFGDALRAARETKMVQLTWTDVTTHDPAADHLHT